MRADPIIADRICEECHKSYTPKTNNQMYCSKSCRRLEMNRAQNIRRKRERALLVKNNPKPVKEIVVKEPVKKPRAKKKYTPISKPKIKEKATRLKLDNSMDYLFDSKKADSIIVNRPCTDIERLMIDEKLASM